MFEVKFAGTGHLWSEPVDLLILLGKNPSPFISNSCYIFVLLTRFYSHLLLHMHEVVELADERQSAQNQSWDILTFKTQSELNS